MDSNPNLFLNQPIMKKWCQPIAGNASYPTSSPSATSLGLYVQQCIIGSRTLPLDFYILP